MRQVRAPLSEQVKAALAKGLATLVSDRGTPILPVVSPDTFVIVKCVIAVLVATGTGVGISITAGLAQSQASLEKLTRHHRTASPPWVSRNGSTDSFSCHTRSSREVSWTTKDYISAHIVVKESGRYNFEGCRIPIPTAIRYDRVEAVLGSDATSKERRVLNLLKYGMPINCKPSFGVLKIQFFQLLVIRRLSKTT